MVDKGYEVTKANSNVFEDIGFDEVEAAHLKIKVELAVALEKCITKKKLKQRETSELNSR